MAKMKNYLLGNGESLMEEFNPKGGGGPKKHPYTFEEARNRLIPQIHDVNSAVSLLPEKATPNNQIVTKFTIHPAYLAKSYFPDKFFRLINQKAIGSRGVSLIPEKWTRKGKPQLSESLVVYTSGKKEAFLDFEKTLQTDRIRNYQDYEDLKIFENIEIFHEKERLKGFDDTIPEISNCEIVLHASRSENDLFIVKSFKEYAESLNIDVNLKLTSYVGGLTFVPAKIPLDSLSEIEKFSFLRCIRPIPKLRTFRGGYTTGIDYTLPDADAISSIYTTAILDAGFNESEELIRWTKSRNFDQNETQEAKNHGTGVTSAFLFGSIIEDEIQQVPYTTVDNINVYDPTDGEELFRSLKNIESTLLNNTYSLANLSIGPSYPIEDDDVSIWTSTLDSILSSRDILLTVASGNDGEKDRASGLARIQPPADSINSLAVGSTDYPDENWDRASYSCIGPGRSPGIVKPDVLDFGGSIKKPFYVINGDISNIGTVGVFGTSYSAPLTLRKAAGIKTTLGEQINMLTVKAILLHNANQKEYESIDVGWGKLPNSIDDFILCKDNQVQVIFQGTIKARQYMKFEIPLPDDISEVGGNYSMKGTLCISTDVNPAHPSNYTRSGIEPIFYTGRTVFKDEKSTNETKSFFPGSDYGKKTEEVQRSDFKKWENVLRADKTFRHSSLQNPYFVFHHNARNAGKDDEKAPDVRFSFILSIESSKDAQLYNKVVRKYRTNLKMLRPIQEIPVSLRQ